MASLLFWHDTQRRFIVC